MINKRLISITASSNTRTYDGTTDAAALPTLTSGTLATGDEGTYSETYDNKNQGTGKTMTPAVVSIVDGNSADMTGNYTVTLTTSSNGTINRAPLTVTAPNIASKEYDGTKTAGAVTVGMLTGFITGETVTATANAADYNSANAGTYNGVPVSYTLYDGTGGGLASNYSLATGSATGVIIPKALSITKPVVATRVYDATKRAGGLNIGTLYGLVGNEIVTVTATIPDYSSANVGTYTCIVTYTLQDGSGGGLATNYSLANGSATGVIVAKALKISAPAIASKVYDGTRSAGAVTVGMLSGFIGRETVTATATAADYSNKNVGTYAGVKITYTLQNGTGGGLAANYSLADGSATGVITAKPMTIQVNDLVKCFGETLSFTGSEFTVSGLISGERSYIS